VPEGVKSLFNSESTEVIVKGNKTARRLKTFWRTASMLVPELLVEPHPEKEEVAIHVSAVPTFEPTVVKIVPEIVEADVPEPTPLTN
jgi:hypothetical protein